MAGSKRIIIVGGGIIGLCSAWYCRQQGYDVTVLERGSPESDSCSLGNAGMIVPSHFVPLAAPGMVTLGLKMLGNRESPFAIKPRLEPDLIAWGWRFVKSATRKHVERSAPLLRDMHLQSRREFERFATMSRMDFGLVRKGLLMLCRTDRALREEKHLAELAERYQVPAEVLTPEETARLDPAIRMTIAGSVFFPNDCHLSPNRFMSGLRTLLERDGVDFQWGQEVEQWRYGLNGIEAAVTRDRIWSGHDAQFVIAGGAWSGQLVRQLGLTVPMQAGQGYSLTLSRPRQLPEICSILTEARVAITPMGDSLRVGGTMEITGLEEPISEARVRGIIKSVPEYFPEFQESDFDGVPRWKGLRPCSPDGLPYVGRSRTHRNLVLATGHAMMGLSLGPVTGKLVSEVVSGETPSLDLALLDPERFS